MNEFRNTLLSDRLWLNEPKEGSENAGKLSLKRMRNLTSGVYPPLE